MFDLSRPDANVTTGFSPVERAAASSATEPAPSPTGFLFFSGKAVGFFSYFLPPGVKVLEDPSPPNPLSGENASDSRLAVSLFCPAVASLFPPGGVLPLYPDPTDTDVGDNFDMYSVDLHDANVTPSSLGAGLLLLHQLDFY